MSEEVLLEKIGNLSMKVEEGFDGIHKRQDITNGRIYKSEKEIDELKLSKTILEQTINNNVSNTNLRFRNTKIIYTLFVVLVSIVASAIGAIIQNYLSSKI